MPLRALAGTRWRVVFYLCVFFALAFAGLAALQGASLPGLLFAGLAGLFMGAIGAPEIEPRAFRRPVLWQIGFSVLGCCLVAAVLSAGFDGYALAVALGVLLGILAPLWIHYIQGP